MKNILLLSTLLCSVTSFAQKGGFIYTAKIGVSTIEFTHNPFPVGSTAILTTGKSVANYSNCAEDPKSKVQKLCLYDSKDGYDYKRNIKVNLSSTSKNPPKTITATYTVDGQPVKFKLVRKGNYFSVLRNGS